MTTPNSNASNTIDGAQIRPESPIRRLDDDRLSRRAFAETIAARIQRAGDGESVVFGLTGPWGSGKTSALNMIRAAISSSAPETWRVVEFTPWAADNELDLVEEFYRVVATAMPNGVKGRRAEKALKAAAPVAKAVIKAALTSLIEKQLGEDGWEKVSTAGSDAVVDALGDIPAGIGPDPFTTRFDTISEAIREAGTNVLVIVDDIDRLHADELLSVMKAVRLLGRFDRVHYMLSYDEDTVLGVLQHTDIAHENTERAQKYLEKIVQYPFALPPIQQQHLEREFRDQFTAVAALRGSTDASAGPADEDVVEQLLQAMPIDRMNLRSVYRLCNQLDILLTLAGGASELNFYDATLTTYLRLHYPRLYTQIPRWRRDLLSSAQQWVDNEQPTAEVKQNEISEYVGADDAHIAYRILVRLFPKTLPKPKYDYIPDQLNGQLIGDRNYFDRYFTFGIPDSDISRHRCA